MLHLPKCSRKQKTLPLSVDQEATSEHIKDELDAFLRNPVEYPEYEEKALPDKTIDEAFETKRIRSFAITKLVDHILAKHQPEGL